MSATPEQQAPGCFGAASTYSTDSVVCQACVAYQPCGVAAYERLQSLRTVVNVKDLLAQHEKARLKATFARQAPAEPVVKSPIPIKPAEVIQKPLERATPVVKVAFEVSPQDQRVVDAIGAKSVKAKEAAAVLCKNNRINDMRAMLPRGQNPFRQTGPRYLRVACDMLIAGGLTKATYKARMMKELDWSDGTAGSHVAVACALLYGFGIMTQDDLGGFVLNPQLTRDNKQST
jgi:hypothetical protein